MNSQNSLDFRTNAASAIKDGALRKAMLHATDTFGTRRTVAMESVDFGALREKASAIRMEVLDNLPAYIERFTIQATKAGASVHRAADATSANTIIADILKSNKVGMVAKGKSMVSEETHLNAHLEKEGFEVVETDLGEYIIQLAGETPSHIIVPAIHKNRRQVGRLFADRLGVDYSEDPQVLTKIARKVLREKFLTADAGISGANFALAESGSLVLLTNEGNGRMVTSVPPLHIAIL
jgi:L-lactate dehydrogenase complex protein LldF